jgi:hypothetical protein
MLHTVLWQGQQHSIAVSGLCSTDEWNTVVAAMTPHWWRHDQAATTGSTLCGKTPKVALPHSRWNTRRVLPATYCIDPGGQYNMAGRT